MRDVYAAPTKDYVVLLLPKIVGKLDGIVEVVLPGVDCNGVLYVRVKLD